MEEEAKEQKVKEQMRLYKERLNAVESKRKEKNCLRIAKGRAKSEFIQEKRDRAANIERHKILKTLDDWRLKERERHQSRALRLAEERGKRLQDHIDRFERIIVCSM